MKLVLRMIQKVAPDKWAEKVEIEKRFEAVEARLGNPAARHYRCMAGADSYWTYIKEKEYDDFASWQEVHDRMVADPGYAEIQALQAEDREKGITMDQRYEWYRLLG